MRAEIRAERDRYYATRYTGGPVATQPAEALHKPDVVPASASAESVDIPDDWRSLHWKRRVQLAKACYPGFEFVNAVDADAAIERHLGVE